MSESNDPKKAPTSIMEVSAYDAAARDNPHPKLGFSRAMMMFAPR